MKVGVAVSDVFIGLFVLSGVLAALRYAGVTGQGQYLDFNLLDSQLAALVNVASNALVSGQTPQRYGNQHANIVPYQTFNAADQDFVVAVGNDRQFVTLCHIIERPDLAADPRFATNPQRIRHREMLLPLLQEIFITRPAGTWVEALTSQGIPAGPINTVSEALQDSHVWERGLVQETVNFATHLRR
jgi:crotonobetainyl-CoA:carnitine CoA-transferase CaiB-like acyl-CoA transferase